LGRSGRRRIRGSVDTSLFRPGALGSTASAEYTVNTLHITPVDHGPDVVIHVDSIKLPKSFSPFKPYSARVTLTNIGDETASGPASIGIAEADIYTGDRTVANDTALKRFALVPGHSKTITARGLTHSGDDTTYRTVASFRGTFAQKDDSNDADLSGPIEALPAGQINVSLDAVVQPPPLHGGVTESITFQISVSGKIDKRSTARLVLGSISGATTSDPLSFDAPIRPNGKRTVSVKFTVDPDLPAGTRLLHIAVQPLTGSADPYVTDNAIDVPITLL
jgi:hypothetical protein